jgi:hypothetical protein
VRLRVTQSGAQREVPRFVRRWEPPSRVLPIRAARALGAGQPSGGRHTIMSLSSEQVTQLRAPFEGKQVGKLPTITCKACRDNKQDKHCDKHQRRECNVCGNFITTAHKHLDYVGHAHVTNRLLDADPEWTWEPMATDQNGFPVFDAQGGLWIRLTVGGVTRPGYGEPRRTGPKEAIGDAIRNAAMRFGVALELWAKGELDASSPDEDSPAASGTSEGVTASAPAPAAGEAPTSFAELVTEKMERLKAIIGDDNAATAYAVALQTAGLHAGELPTQTQMTTVLNSLDASLQAVPA